MLNLTIDIEHETIFFACNIKNQTLNLWHKNRLEQKLKFLSSILMMYAVTKLIVPTFLIGELNLNLLTDTCLPLSFLMNTYVTRTSSTLIDVCFTNSPDICVSTSVINCGFSDHDLI